MLLRLLTAVLVCGVCLAVPSSFSAQSTTLSYIKDSQGHYRAVQGQAEHALAVAVFDNTQNTTGWGVLNVKTFAVAGEKNEKAMYAAGYLEGKLTLPMIADTYKNLVEMFLPKGMIPAVKTFLDRQSKWSRDMVASHPSDPYWIQAGLVIAQFDGLRDAMREGGITDEYAADILNLSGDFLDLLPAVDPSTRVDWFAFDHASFMTRIVQAGHCSALIKVTDDYSDLFISQVAWFTYGAMNRIYKHYDFAAVSHTIGARVSFSSYPGMLESLDDFYIMNSGLVMIQTTNSVLDASLFSLVTPDALYAWQRVRIANTMAATGKQWFDTFKIYNSGTYNNQYMVVDLNLYTPSSPLPNDMLWVIEQIPGYVEGADQTALLRLGYWPSYNVPYFTTTYVKSGYPEAVAKYGPDASYDLAPRAKIFRRDHVKAVDLASFKELMRSNDFETDPFSEHNTYHAICSRGDLASPPSYAGCYDGKVTTYALALNMTSEAVNGPTRGRAGKQYPAFSWDAQGPTKQLHFGEPTKYDFDWVEMKPLAL